MNYRISIHGKHIDVDAREFRWLANLMDGRIMGVNIEDSGINIEPIHPDASDPQPTEKRK